MCENRRGKEVVIAIPVREVFALMVLAAFFFFAAGALNGVYPGGPAWIDHAGGYAWVMYLFGLLNLVVAALIWRGNERGLLTRMVLALVFIVVIVGLLLISPLTPALTVIYAVTAFLEVIILVQSFRVWRLGRGADASLRDEVFSLDTPLPVATPEVSVVAPPRVAFETLHGPAVLSARLTWAIGLLSLALAASLVADGVLSGFVPGGGEWGLYGKQSGWLVYIFAMICLVVAVRAVHGSTLSLRLLLVTGLLVVVERLFSFVALGGTTPLGLVLRVITAMLALAMAIVSVAGLRSAEAARRATTRITLQHATGGQ